MKKITSKLIIFIFIITVLMLNVISQADDIYDDGSMTTLFEIGDSDNGEYSGYKYYKIKLLSGDEYLCENYTIKEDKIILMNVFEKCNSCSSEEKSEKIIIFNDEIRTISKMRSTSKRSAQQSECFINTIWEK